MSSDNINKHLSSFYHRKPIITDYDELLTGIKNSSRSHIAKAITLTENDQLQYDEKVISFLSRLPVQYNSLRIAVSGPPGAGKSTFIEQLGLLLIEGGHKVAVLAIDPSSHIHKGSILGDKTRMNELSNAENAFIRPSPGVNEKGGIRKSTFDAIRICEAAGYDVIIIETIGVGQAEFDVVHITDFFILLLAPAAGDSLQGIKKGIVEVADMIVINKCDGNLETAANEAINDYKEAIHYSYSPKTPGIEKKVFGVSSITPSGFEPIIQIIDNLFTDKAFFSAKIQNRNNQLRTWFVNQSKELILYILLGNEEVKNILNRFQSEIKDENVNIYTTMEKLTHYLKDHLKF